MAKIYTTKDLTTFYKDIENGLLTEKMAYKDLSIFKFLSLKDEIIFWDHDQNYVGEHKKGLSVYSEQQGEGWLTEHGGGEVFLSKKDGGQCTLTFKGKSLYFGEPKEHPFKALFIIFQNELQENGVNAEYEKGYELSWERIRKEQLENERIAKKSKRLWIIIGSILAISTVVYFLLLR